MPKSKVKKAINKASEGMTFVKDVLDTVRSKPLAEPVRTALGVTEFKPEQPLTEDQNVPSASDSLSIDEFLNEIDLIKLLDLFKEEEVTMDVLWTFNDDDLKNIGVTKYGQRRKILIALSNLGYPG